MTKPISPYWAHLNTGMWLRVLSQDRVEGTVLTRERFPDGREFWVTLKIVDVEEIADEQEDEQT